MLILEIALGIFLAALALEFWPFVLAAAGVVALIALLGLGALLGVAVISSTHSEQEWRPTPSEQESGPALD